MSQEILNSYPHAMDMDSASGKPMSKVVSNMTKAVSVVPDDLATINPTKGLYLGGSGDVVVTMADGGDITLKGLSAGTIHQISVVAIKFTGTTATSIVAMY